MEKQVLTNETTPPDFNLSLHQYPLSTNSDNIPSFGVPRSGNDNDHDNITSSQMVPETSVKGSNSPTKTLKDRITPPEPLVTKVVKTQPQRCSSAKNRQQPWKSTLRNHDRSGYSPSSSTFGSSFYLSVQNKGREIARNRDSSPATATSDLSQYIDKKTLNRSFELRSASNAANKEIHDRGKATGKLVLDMKKQRKEMETQVNNLEMRIKRLKDEELSAMKKMERANSQLEKTQMIQAQKKEETEEKIHRKKSIEESVQKKRAEINNQREKDRISSSNAVLEMLRGRYINALSMKREAEERQAHDAERKMYEEERKRAVKDGIKSWLDASKLMNNANRDYTNKKKSMGYIEKAKLEREKAQELMEKSQQLEAIEKELVMDLIEIQKKKIETLGMIEGIQRNSLGQ